MALAVSDCDDATTRTFSARRSGSGSRPRSAVAGSSATPLSVADEIVGDAVDERGGARLAAGEGDGRGRLEDFSLEQAAKVDLDVVTGHLDERCALLGLGARQAGNGLHRPTVGRPPIPRPPPLLGLMLVGRYEAGPGSLTRG